MKAWANILQQQADDLQKDTEALQDNPKYLPSEMKYPDEVPGIELTTKPIWAFIQK